MNGAPTLGPAPLDLWLEAQRRYLAWCAGPLACFWALRPNG